METLNIGKIPIPISTSYEENPYLYTTNMRNPLYYTYR